MAKHAGNVYIESRLQNVTLAHAKMEPHVEARIRNKTTSSSLREVALPTPTL